VHSPQKTASAPLQHRHGQQGFPNIGRFPAFHRLEVRGNRLLRMETFLKIEEMAAVGAWRITCWPRWLNLYFVPANGAEIWLAFWCS
jgi:hypothetical protein